MTRAFALTATLLLLSWQGTAGQPPPDTGVLSPPEGGVETLGSESARSRVSCGDISGDVVISVGAVFWTRLLRQDPDALPIDVRNRNGIVLAFRATGASDVECCWLQFVWIEVAMSGTPEGGERRDGLSPQGEILTPQGPRELTRAGEQPRWAVDSGNPRDEQRACYDPAGAALPRTEGDPSTTILDCPASSRFEVPSAKRERTSRSRETVGSPASIFATLDWLDLIILASWA